MVAALRLQVSPELRQRGGVWLKPLRRAAWLWESVTCAFSSRCEQRGENRKIRIRRQSAVAGAFPFRLNMTNRTLFIDAVCEGADCDPWGEGALPVPDRFSEHGEPPVVTTGPVPPGAVEVSGGRVLVRIVGEPGTVTSRSATRRRTSRW